MDQNWTISDLFPTCFIPTCPHYGTSHILPCQQEALTAQETFIYWQAGVGASKTIVLGTLALFYMLVIPENRGILFRKDFGLNGRTVWMRFKNAVKIALDKNIIPCPKHLTPAQYLRKMFSYSKKDIGPTLCTFPNGSEMYAGQTKNMSEAMGPEYGFIGVDDAMENDYEVFTGLGTVGGFQSRLRHPQAAFYKVSHASLRPIQSLWPDMEPGTFLDMRKCFLDSNPPTFDHWLWRVFGKVPGVKRISIDELHEKETYCRFILTSTQENDHLPPGYIEETASFHDEEDLARLLGGKSVPFYGGIKVYREFQPEKHVGSFDPNPDYPLFVSLDPGYQHPAAIISQISHCALNYPHHITLSEISNLYDISTWDFMEKEDSAYSEYLGVLPHLGLYYPTHFNWLEYTQKKETTSEFSALESSFGFIQFCCDRSADKTFDSNRDKRSCRKIWRQEYGIQTRQKYLGIEKSTNQLRRLFKETCPCGLARILINNKCLMLIEGYSGGYRFRKLQNGSHSDKPLEDHKFEDVSDAHRYNIENFFLAEKPIEREENIIPLKEDYLVLQERNHQWLEFFT